MHIEFLVEDLSGKVLLMELVPRILAASGGDHTFRVHHYRGIIGHLPTDLRTSKDPYKRILLDQLPRLLRGYARHPGVDAVVVVLDVDTRPRKQFLSELRELLRDCRPAPKETLFRLAIEEMGAWLLGERAAIIHAYPRAKRRVLDEYQQDSICGTWEVLADCVHSGGRQALRTEGHSEVGRSKSEWAREIGSRMNIEANRSPSFQKFLMGVKRLIDGAEGTISRKR